VITIVSGRLRMRRESSRGPRLSDRRESKSGWGVSVRDLLAAAILIPPIVFKGLYRG
jgi:hypothetical protein